MRRGRFELKGGRRENRHKRPFLGGSDDREKSGEGVPVERRDIQQHGIHIHSVPTSAGRGSRGRFTHLVLGTASSRSASAFARLAVPGPAPLKCPKRTTTRSCDGIMSVN